MRKHVMAALRGNKRDAPASRGAQTQRIPGVNLSLGLTFYCSASRLAAPPPRFPSKGLRTMQRPPARLLASAAVLAALAVGGCSTTTTLAGSPDTTGSIATDTAPRTAVQWRQEMDSWGAALPRQSGRSGRGGPLRPGAARHRPARAGRRRARAIGDPQSGQSRRARRLWPGARRQRQLPAGARRAQPRPHARTSPIGASCRCRARCSIRWAAMPTRSGTTPARCG